MKRISLCSVLMLAMAGLIGGCEDDQDEAPPPPPATTWSIPVAVAPGGCPIESRDGSLLYTAAGPAASNGLDIWVLRRNATTNVYDSRTRLGEPVSTALHNDFCPTPLMGEWLMFVSTRDAATGESPRCSQPTANPGTGGADIFLTRFAVGAPGTNGELQVQSTGPAVRLACYPDGPNTSGTKFAPSLLTTADGGYLFFSSEHNGTQASGSQDIYVSDMRPNGTYGPGVAVAALNTAFEDQQPNVSRDGLTIVFASNREGNMDIYMSTRASLTADWSTPVNLSVQRAFPTAASAETRPSISWDQQRLYYGADGQSFLSIKTPAN